MSAAVRETNRHHQEHLAISAQERRPHTESPAILAALLLRHVGGFRAGC
jgi:hypothetical protein